MTRNKQVHLKFTKIKTKHRNMDMASAQRPSCTGNLLRDVKEMGVERISGRIERIVNVRGARI